MATKARRGGSLATILNANTSAASNTVVIDSGGDISLSGSLTVTSGVIGYATNTTLQATFAQNTAIVNVANDRLQVANAAVAYVTKSTALTSNNALVNLINDRYQVANADVKFVTKSVQLTSNNSLVNLINDRIQVANVSTTLGTYWPSANVIAYTDSTVAADTKSVNTSIFIATGGENRVAIPYTNTNFILVYLNGVLLTEDTDYVAANNVHIGGIDPVLAAGDVLLVEEYKNHNANTQNRTPGGGGGGATGAQGSATGYAMGGDPSGAGQLNVVDKWSFTSDGNATDVGDLPVSVAPYGGGGSSTTKGYSFGGYSGSDVESDIHGMPFAAESPIADAGDLHPLQGYRSTQAVDASNAFTTGGFYNAPPFTATTLISKFPFASEGTATDSGGDLTVASGVTSIPSPSNAYVVDDGTVNIYKFPFAISSGTVSDVMDLSTSGNPYHASSQSTTHGYVGHGGQTNPFQASNLSVDKFAFASDTLSAGVLCVTGTGPATYKTRGGGQQGNSSDDNGYTTGGNAPTDLNIIDKFPFASDSNATDVGDLTVARRNHTQNVQV